MPKVTIIQPTKPDDSGKIRAAAYCRVSTNTADQHHSYTVQMEYYTRLFENSTTELLVGIYADEGISGGMTSSVCSGIAEKERSTVSIPSRSAGSPGTPKTVCYISES